MGDITSTKLALLGEHSVGVEYTGGDTALVRVARTDSGGPLEFLYTDTEGKEHKITVTERWFGSFSINVNQFSYLVQTARTARKLQIAHEKEEEGGDRDELEA